MMTLSLTPEDSLFARVGEERLRRVLWAFYARATADDLLGPVFARIGPFPRGGGPLHIARLKGFWRAVTGGPSAYRGHPGPAHTGLGIGPAHFDRWLALWEQTLGEELPAAEAAALLGLARRMHPNLERHALATPPEAVRVH